MELFTSRLTLREFRADDFDSFRELETHPSTYHYESACPDEPAIQKYLESAQSDALQTPRVRYLFAMVFLDEKVHGRVTLALINASIREWEIGWAVHPAEWGKGIATEAARRVLEFSFRDLHAHRVVAFSHAQNVASLRVMEKLGMRQEGHIRETRRWHGDWADEAVFSILEREWH